MLGAAALDASVLKGRTMLNLDSEDEGVLTVSCAGGNVSVCTLPVTRAPFSGTALTVTVGGLLGGNWVQSIARWTTSIYSHYVPAKPAAPKSPKLPRTGY